MRRGALTVSVLLACASGLVQADDRLASRAVGSGVEPVSALPMQREEQPLRAELAILSAKAADADKRVLVRGRALYRLVRVGVLPVGAGLGSLFEHAVKVERTRRALEQDMAALRSMGERKTALVRKLDEMARQAAAREADRLAAARMQEAMDDPDDRAPTWSRVTPTSATDGLPALTRMSDGRATQDTQSDDSPDGFRSMKGRLPSPLAVRAEIRRVRRPGAPGPGLELATTSGTPVRAIFPGRVAFADRYDARGSVVILDHGDHFYSVMGDLGSIDVRVGDDLSAGARIGTVGGENDKGDWAESPADRRPRRSSALYFEIRRGSTAVDPGPWLGL